MTVDEVKALIEKVTAEVVAEGERDIDTPEGFTEGAEALKASLLAHLAMPA